MLSRRGKIGLKKLIELTKTSGKDIITLKEARVVLGRNASFILKELIDKGFITGIKPEGAISYLYFYINKDKLVSEKGDMHV